MALTLIEAAKLHSGTELQATVVEIFARSHGLLAALPFSDIKGNALHYNREGVPPGIGFRGVNEAYTESTGILNPITETLAIAGGDIDVDRFILKTMGEDQRSAQEAFKIKALSHKWANTVIKGDNATSPKEFDGLQRRLVGNQLIDAGSTSGGDALSLAKLDQLIDAVTSPTHLLMSKAMRRLITVASRTTTVGGFITFEQDEFGMQVVKYNGLPIITMDDNDYIYATLAFDEVNPGGGSNVGTSIYCVSLREQMLQGIQNGIPEVEDLGHQNAKPVMRTRIEWFAGLALFHPQAAARLRGIKNAAVVV